MRLFHVSDLGNIDRFIPRAASKSHPDLLDPVVWGVDEVHLPNYLLPRDCPRVCFRKTERTISEDAALLLGKQACDHTVIIETAWLERARNEQLFLYRLPIEMFELWDSEAGYYISRSEVVPVSRTLIRKPLDRLQEYKVELKVVDDLWPWQKAVVDSNLQFSCIRMRNAQTRPASTS